jgi:dihydroorotate dehydrogenase (NAD+) catalytic subunit
MLNAIGLANVGLERFVEEKVPYLSGLEVPVIANVAGHGIDDYVTVCERLDAIECIAAVELNVSCPNVADGLEWGTDAGRLEKLVGAARRVCQRSKLIVKLTPNVADVPKMARAAVAGGADILSLINTLRGMAINVDTREPVLANVVGGLSGPAIRPVALFLVHQVYQEVARPAGVPVVAMGGIRTWRDGVEFLLAGATGLAIGTAMFVDPRTPMYIRDGLIAYLQRHRQTRVADIVGQLRLPDR